jgi:pantoate--beta-alanine ligase
MIILKTTQEVKQHLSDLKRSGKIVGFIPTMGALHDGHISLIGFAKAGCDVIVSSIFVNPTQFNDLSDLKNYPRTLESDCAQLQKAGCNVVFAPDVTEMYSAKELELKAQQIEDDSWKGDKIVDFGLLDKVMEGAHRKGHFNGVAQVVSKLFKIVEPNKAYFGQKDFQQLAIIRSMTRQMDMEIDIIGCPIVRESNGLAMSSRNTRLTADQRNVASTISKTLFKAKELIGTKTIVELKDFAEAELRAESQFKLEYFEIADVETLQPVVEYSDAKSAVACVALKLHNVRLIDNIILY